MKLHFYGGAQTVTGANYLLETDQARVLVDCGMFQGVKHAEERNYKDFSYDPASIDAVLITHAHVDHIGRLPKLYRDGYRGPVYSTPPTHDLMLLSLEDSVGIIAGEARRDGHPPLYEKKDIKQCVDDLCTYNPYNTVFDVAPGIRARFRNASHILGSAIIEVWASDQDGEEKTIVFSGDLGGTPPLILPPRDTIAEADYVLMESVYGDRVHEDREERRMLLENIVTETIGRGGTLMIPSFAVERTQELLFDFNNLVENDRVPSCPIFLDSPLAIGATRIYRKYGEYFNKAAKDLIAGGDRIFKFPGLKFTEETEESKAINDVAGPKIIIAGSGMSTGGRILHHERRYLPEKNNAILFIGYQAAGTLGRRILDGQTPVRIFGDEIPVRCHVEAIGGYSGHADQHDLEGWLRAMKTPPEHVFVVQGEPGPAMDVAQRVQEDLGIEASAPMTGDVVNL